MEHLEPIYARIDREFDRHLERVRRFVRQPSISGEGVLKAIRAFGMEPELWPNIAGSAPFYLFSRELRQPFAMGGLGHGGRAHSPNEYATVEGMRLFEKSMARFVYEFAALHG